MPPGASLKEAARLLVDNRISGLPVVDEEGLLGILSETDIVAAEAGGSHTLAGGSDDHAAIRLPPMSTMLSTAPALLDPVQQWRLEQLQAAGGRRLPATRRRRAQRADGRRPPPDVASVRPDTPLKAVAKQLVERRISGMPVVNEDGEVLGVISEADLLVKEGGVAPRRPGLLAWLLDPLDPEAQIKLEARVAGEAMTSPAITIAPIRSIAAAAQEMLERGINRLPVVRNGRLVGIVSRADLVRAFARSDKQIAGEVRDQVEYLLALEDDFSDVDVSVEGGEATLGGRVRRRSTTEAVTGLVAKVPGIVGVRSELTWVEDDSKPRRAPVRERTRYPL